LDWIGLDNVHSTRQVFVVCGVSVAFLICFGHSDLAFLRAIWQ